MDTEDESFLIPRVHSACLCGQGPSGSEVHHVPRPHGHTPSPHSPIEALARGAAREGTGSLRPRGLSPCTLGPIRPCVQPRWGRKWLQVLLMVSTPNQNESGCPDAWVPSRHEGAPRLGSPDLFRFLLRSHLPPLLRASPGRLHPPTVSTPAQRAQWERRSRNRS